MLFSLVVHLPVLRRAAVRLLPVALLGVLFVGCRLWGGPAPTPIVVTEVVTFDDGETVVITRVLTPTPTRNVPTPAPTIPVRPQPVTLDIGVIQPFAPLDPQRASGRLAMDLIENVYVGLTHYNQSANRVEGELAERWAVSVDGRVYRFELRDDFFWVQALLPTGSRFRPAEPEPLAEVATIRPVDAEDVTAAVRRACSAENQTDEVSVLYIIEGCERVHNLAQPSERDLATIGVTALTSRIVEFRLREPAAWFPALLTLPALRPIPREQVARAATDRAFDWLDPTRFTSSGPFLLSPLTDLAAQPNPVVVLQRNPHWPADRQLSGNVELVNLLRFESRLAAHTQWAANQLDLTPLPASLSGQYLGPVTYPPLRATTEVFYLGFNLDSPLFSVPEVRRAFSAAIDREVLLERIAGGRGLPMRHFVPPGVQHAAPIDQAGLGYSPDYARLQMLQSGFRACQLLGEITYLVNATDAALQQAEALIDMWVKELGCAREQFRVQQVRFGTLLANTARQAGPARPDLFDLGWSSFVPDAHDWFYTVLHCRGGENRPNRPCAEVDRWIEQAAVNPSFDERSRFYRQIENAFFGEGGSAPIAPLYVRADYMLTQNWVLAYLTAPFGGEPYDGYWVDGEIKQFERSR